MRVVLDAWSIIDAECCKPGVSAAVVFHAALVGAAHTGNITVADVLAITVGVKRVLIPGIVCTLGQKVRDAFVENLQHGGVNIIAGKLQTLAVSGRAGEERTCFQDMPGLLVGQVGAPAEPLKICNVLCGHGCGSW